MTYIYCRESELHICDKDICCGVCPRKACPKRCPYITINCGSLTDEAPIKEDGYEKKTIKPYKYHM